ncbi:hypothetical protein ACFYNZ_16345 [Streptomyces kebangsaanensis]|uniref:Uncharacterized protein n=1 Tax=Streptomyces kebangsaanensis TaxID=864058 RepID=A0ABW6KT37_9ACTN
MSTMPQVPDEMRMKHLELLQTTIGRLGTNSFLIKGWAMTVSGGLITVAMGSAGWAVAVIALMMTSGFWLLDTYYLEQERLFRSLYDRSVAPDSAQVPLFSMDAERYAQSVPWRRVALSRTMALFYGTLALVDIAVALALLTTS